MRRACTRTLALHATGSPRGVHLLSANEATQTCVQYVQIELCSALTQETVDRPQKDGARHKTSRMTSCCCLASDVSSSSSDHSEPSELLEMKTVDPGRTEIDHVSLLLESLRLLGESRNDEGQSLGEKVELAFLGVEGPSLGIDGRSESVLGALEGMDEICDDDCEESRLDGGAALGGDGAKGGTISVAVSSVVPDKSDWGADSMEVMFDSDLATGASPRATETTIRGAPA